MGIKLSTETKVANNPMDVNIFKKKNNEKREKDRLKKEKKKLKKEKERERKRMKKEKRIRKVENTVQVPITPVPPIRPPTNETDYEMMAKLKIKKQLQFDSETFILNQLLFSVEFFRNYQGDILEAARLNKLEQEEQTMKILKYNKRVLILDRIIKTMERRLIYEYRHGPMKGEPQTLQRFTMYIVFENIEIIKQSEIEDTNGIYSRIEDTSDRQSLKIVIDNDEKFNKVDGKTHVGFYRLRNSEIIFPSKYGQNDLYNANDDYDDADEDEDDEITRTTQIKPNRKIRDSIAVQSAKGKLIQQQVLQNYKQFVMRPSSSTPSPSSSEYDYTYINNINSHRPLNEMRTTFVMGEPLKLAQTVPQSCFINVKVKPEDDDEDDDEEDDDDDDSYTKKPPQIKQSFHSNTFFCYFTSAFRQTLAAELGFGEEQINNATWKGASIFVEPFEIVPAIQCKWPDRIAYDFINRPRHSIRNQATGKSYQWPPKEVITHVINKQCYIIPNGYAPKDGDNPEREFEWQIVFPAAEQYLESNLSNAQLKIYIIFKILIKTFIEPLISDRYDLTDHIRHHLFWQFERQYPIMSDDCLGERLMHILNSLLLRIGKTTIYDYFLPKRNLLYNIPSNVLIAVHEGLYRITEFPVRHLIIALRNLYVIDRPFYPTLNYKRLYEALTKDPLEVLNPNLAGQRNRDKEAQQLEENFNDIIAVGAIGLLEQQARKEKKGKRTVRFNDNKLTKQKGSVESINQFVVDKRMDERRRQIIFDLFIPHYIIMAKHSANFSAFEQSLLFLDQAKIFCSILAADGYNVQAYTEEIDGVRETVMAAKVARNRELQNGPAVAPPLPRRESILDSKLQAPQRRVTVARKSVTIVEMDDDPYTNIDLLRSSIGIPPAEYSNSDDDESTPSNTIPNGVMNNGPRKSILANHTNRVQVQVHTHRPPIIDGRNDDLRRNMGNTTKTTVNISNRRKSSTRFNVANGFGGSDEDSDEDITTAQVHTPRQQSTNNKNDGLVRKNLGAIPKTTVNISNRRKSSTKFIVGGMTNGFGSSDESDDAITVAKVHTPKQLSFDDQIENITRNNKTQELNNNNTTANIANRRKSSTKFHTANGFRESDESDENNAGDTSF